MQAYLQIANVLLMFLSLFLFFFDAGNALANSVKTATASLNSFLAIAAESSALVAEVMLYFNRVYTFLRNMLRALQLPNRVRSFMSSMDRAAQMVGVDGRTISQLGATTLAKLWAFFLTALNVLLDFFKKLWDMLTSMTQRMQNVFRDEEEEKKKSLAFILSLIHI